MGDMFNAKSSRRVRIRRSGEEVRALIAGAARAVFAERGFAGATTREIADRAGASEVLIFRYFGNKAAMFDEVIVAPFDRLIGDFLDAHRDLEMMPDRSGGNEQFVRSIYPFLKTNADLLQALAKSSGDAAARGTPIHGLDNYFVRAAERMRLQYAREGVEAEVAPELSVRYAFGLLAAAILLNDWFFPDGQPDEDAVTHALTRMLYKALSPLSPATG
jgi:AcrR family transcriptional regulator